MQIEQRGISGERTKSMIKRLPRILDKKKYAVVIVLGGTPILYKDTTQLHTHTRHTHTL